MLYYIFFRVLDGKLAEKKVRGSACILFKISVVPWDFNKRNNSIIISKGKNYVLFSGTFYSYL